MNYWKGVCLLLFYSLLTGCPELTDKDTAIETTKYSIVVYHKEDWSTASMVIEYIDSIVDKVGRFFPEQKLPKFYLVILPSDEAVRFLCTEKGEITAFHRESSDTNIDRIVVSAESLGMSKQVALEILAHEVAHMFVKSHPDGKELVKQILDRLYL